MRRWRHWIAERCRQDRGSASLEFITVGLILLVPLVYVVLTMSAIQGAAFAVEGAARQSVRVFVQAPNDAEASARAQRAIRFALADAGLDGLQPRITVSCSPRPHACLTRLGTVTISVGVTVPLPLVPPVLDLSVPLGVPLQATSTERVSRFWGAG